MSGASKVLLAVPDLMFGTRITDTVRALGWTPLEVAAAHLSAAAAADVVLIVVDTGQRDDWEGAVRALKADPTTAAVPILAYAAHVDVTATRAAVAAGCDRLVTRGKLMAELPDLLRSTARKI